MTKSEKENCLAFQIQGVQPGLKIDSLGLAGTPLFPNCYSSLKAQFSTVPSPCTFGNITVVILTHNRS